MYKIEMSFPLLEWELIGSCAKSLFQEDNMKFSKKLHLRHCN